MLLGVVMESYKNNQVIKCLVTGIEKYGIFVNIDKTYSGLIHISEVSNEFVRDLNDYVQKGDMIFAKIIDIDYDSKQMKLSIKDIDYKNSGEKKKSLESANGFTPLKDALGVWTKEKLQEITDKKTSSN